MPLPVKPRATASQSLLCGGGGGEWRDPEAVRAGLLPLEDAARALLRPRGLGTQDSPDCFVKDSLQASLGES